jgi:hypothetical protein
VPIIAVKYVSAYSIHISGLHRWRVSGCFQSTVAADTVHAPLHCDGTSVFTSFEKAYDSFGKAALRHYRLICCRLWPAFFVATWYQRSTLLFFFFFFATRFIGLFLWVMFPSLFLQCRSHLHVGTSPPPTSLISHCWTSEGKELCDTTNRKADSALSRHKQ